MRHRQRQRRLALPALLALVLVAIAALGLAARAEDHEAPPAELSPETPITDDLHVSDENGHEKDGGNGANGELLVPDLSQEVKASEIPGSEKRKDSTVMAQEALSLLRSLAPRLDPLPSGPRSRSLFSLPRALDPVLGYFGAGKGSSLVASFANLDPADTLPVVAESDPEDVKRAKAIRILETIAEEGNEEALFVMAELNFFASFGHPRNLSRAFQLYAECSDKHGNATAQGMVGFMYATGFGAPEMDQAKAMLYYTFAALGHDASSEMALGYRYLAGIGTQKNCDEAVWYYRKAAQKSINYWLSGPPGGYPSPPSKHRLTDDDGGTYGSGASGAGNPNPSGRSAGDGALSPDDVLQYWQYTAERGDASAQFLLGQLYHSGTGAVAQNYAQALKYFHLAALQYDPPPPNPNGGPVQITQAHANRLNAAAQAAGQLGQMYLRGEGVDVDNATARRWFEKGAQHNEGTSLYGLGMMHLDGSGGFPRDIKRAYQLFLKAAEHNNANAQANLGELYLRQGKKEYTNALKYFTLASRQGHLLAMFRLGDMYLEGQGTQSNCMVAAAFFKSVSERGDWHDPLLEDALDAFEDGDMETAFLDYVLSAERGYEVAQTNAAWMIDQGFYPAGSTSLFEPGRDPWALALVYWNRAANQGNVDARVKVGDYYYYGLGYENVYAPIKSQKPEAAPGQQGTLSPAEGDAVVDEAKTVEESKGSTEAALVTPPARPIWHRVLATIFGWSILGAPNFERAAMYYQTAADSEHSSLAMWNLGWMHECGVGVERDFHLAKRYYDRSLSTNPEGYLPITIALSKLRAKQIVYGLLGLESSTSGTTPKSKVTRRDDEQIVPKVDSLPAPGEAPPEREAPKSEEGEGYEWWEKQGAAVESTTENVLIAVLFGLLGLLLFVRLRHGQWRGDYQAAVAAGQVAAEAGPGLNPNGVAAFAAGANAANGLVPDRVGTPRPNQQAAGSGSELRQRRPGQADGAEAPRA